jgi:hypothetical protein
MKQREQNLIKKFQKFFPTTAATAACIETSTFNYTNYSLTITYIEAATATTQNNQQAL